MCHSLWAVTPFLGGNPVTLLTTDRQKSFQEASEGDLWGKIKDGLIKTAPTAFLSMESCTNWLVSVNVHNILPNFVSQPQETFFLRSHTCPLSLTAGVSKAPGAAFSPQSRLVEDCVRISTEVRDARFSIDSSHDKARCPYLKPLLSFPLDTCYLTLPCSPTTLTPWARTLCGSPDRIYRRFNGWVVIHAERMLHIWTKLWNTSWCFFSQLLHF